MFVAAGARSLRKRRGHGEATATVIAFLRVLRGFVVNHLIEALPGR
jgi:hypothetical protein